MPMQSLQEKLNRLTQIEEDWLNIDSSSTSTPNPKPPHSPTSPFHLPNTSSPSIPEDDILSSPNPHLAINHIFPTTPIKRQLDKDGNLIPLPPPTPPTNGISDQDTPASSTPTSKSTPLSTGTIPPATTPADKLPNMDERPLLPLSSSGNKSRPYRISKALKAAEMADAVALEGESPQIILVLNTKNEMVDDSGGQGAQSINDDHPSGDESENAGGVDLGLGITFDTPIDREEIQAPAADEVAKEVDEVEIDNEDANVQEDGRPDVALTPSESWTDAENTPARSIESDTSPTTEVANEDKESEKNDSVITEIESKDTQPPSEDITHNSETASHSIESAMVQAKDENEGYEHPEIRNAGGQAIPPNEESMSQKAKSDQEADSEKSAKDEGSDKENGSHDSEDIMIKEEGAEAKQPDDKSSTRFGNSDDGANSDDSVTSKASDKGSGSDNSSGIMIDNNGADMQHPNDKSSLEENVSDGAKNDPSTMSSSSHDEDLIDEDEDIKTQQPTDDVSTKPERPDDEATIDALNNATELNKTDDGDLVVEKERAATQKPNTNTGVRSENSDDEAENDIPTSNDSVSDKSVDNNTPGLMISNELAPTRQTSDSTSTEEKPSKGEEGDRNVSTTDSFSDLDGNIFHEMRPLIEEEKEHIEVQKPINDNTFTSQNPNNETGNDAPTSISPSSGNYVNKTDNEGLTMQNQHLAAHELGNDASVQVLEEADGNLPTTGSFSSSDGNIINNERHPIEKDPLEAHEPSDDAPVKSENPDHAVQEYSPEINPSESKSDGDEDIRSHIFRDECDEMHEPSDHISIKEDQAPNEIEDGIVKGGDENKDSEDTNFKDNFSEIHPCDDDEFVEEQAFDEGAESEEPGSSSEDDNNKSDDECIVFEDYTKSRHSSEEPSSDRQTGITNEEVDEAATKKAVTDPLPTIPTEDLAAVENSEHTDSYPPSDDSVRQGEGTPDWDEGLTASQNQDTIDDNGALAHKADRNTEAKRFSPESIEIEESSRESGVWDFLPKADDENETKECDFETSKKGVLDPKEDPTKATQPEIETQQQSQNPHTGSSANSADSQGSNTHEKTKGDAHLRTDVSASNPKRDARAAVQTDLDALMKKMKAEKVNKDHGANDGSTHVDARKQKNKVKKARPSIESSPQEGDPIHTLPRGRKQVKVRKPRFWVWILSACPIYIFLDSLWCDPTSALARYRWYVFERIYNGICLPFNRGVTQIPELRRRQFVDFMNEEVTLWSLMIIAGGFMVVYVLWKLVKGLMKVVEICMDHEAFGREAAGVATEQKRGFTERGIDLLLDAMSYSTGV